MCWKKIINIVSFSFIDKWDEPKRQKLTLICNFILAVVAMIGIIFICVQIWMQWGALEQQNRAIQQTQTQIQDNQLLLNNTFNDMNRADYRNAANLVIGSSLFDKNYTAYNLLNSQYSSYPAILYLGEWSTTINDNNEEMVHYYSNENLMKTGTVEKESTIFLWVVNNSSEIKPRDGINIYINNSNLKNGNNALRINMPYGDLSMVSGYKRVWGLFSLDYNSSTKEIVKASLISSSRFPDVCTASPIKVCVQRVISGEATVEVRQVD